MFSTDQRRQVVGSQGLKATFHRTLADHAPNWSRPVNTLQLMGAEVHKFEGIAQKLPRQRADDHLA